MKTFLKYVLSFYVILSASFANLHAHTQTQKETVKFESFSFDFNESSAANIFSDAHHTKKDFALTIIEKEVDDETKSHKTKLKLCAKHSSFSCYNAENVFSDIQNEFPAYAHFEKVFNRRYVLYRVFRI